MIFRNERGRKVDISFYDTYEGPQVEEAWYLNSDTEAVSKEDIEYILSTYAADIEELLESA